MPIQMPSIAMLKPRPAIEPAVYDALRKRYEPRWTLEGYTDSGATCNECFRNLAT